MEEETKLLKIPKGTMLFAEGDDASRAYLIYSGKVEIFRKKNDKRASLHTAGANEVIGEMAILTERPRTASAICVEDCEVYAISRETMQEKMDGADPLLRFIIEKFITDLERTSHLVMSLSPVLRS